MVCFGLSRSGKVKLKSFKGDLKQILPHPTTAARQEGCFERGKGGLILLWSHEMEERLRRWGGEL